MFETKRDILEYYENLKNQIDIHAESLIFKEKIDVSSIHFYRTKFLDKIQIIRDNSLENLSNNNENEQEFAFFLPRTNFIIDLKIFQSNIFGFLIFVNQYIEQNVIQHLKKILNKEIAFKRQILLNGKDTIILNLFRNLIEKKFEFFQGFINLSDSTTNLLDKFEIGRNYVEFLNKNDFNIIKKLINSKKLTFCDFEFKSLQEIVENQFYELNGIKKFSLQVDEQCLFRSGCFNGLKSLESLLIEGIGRESFTNRLFIGISNLTHLEISYSSIHSLDRKFFDDLTKLKYLKLDSNYLKTINGTAFRGLKQLTVLESNKNRIFSLDKDAFSNINSLKFLTLQNFVQNSTNSLSFLNNMANIECLVLTEENYSLNNIQFQELPNLKFFCCCSKIVPKLSKNNIVFLEIENLNQISNNSFVSCNNLKGLSLKVNKLFMKEFRELRVENLQSIEFFSIKFEFQVEENDFKDIKKLFGLSDKKFISWKNSIMILSNYVTKENFLKKEILVESDLQERILEYMER